MYSESKNILSNRTEGYCLIPCQTGVLFSGHPVLQGNRSELALSDRNRNETEDSDIN